MAEATLRLVDVQGNALETPELINNEVVFKGDHKWVWCMDARFEPYNALDEKEVLARAAKNRKRYVLFNA